MDMRVDLEVPFTDKDKAKRLGARWDPDKFTWYVQDTENLWPFVKWMKEKHRKPVAPKSKKK